MYFKFRLIYVYVYLYGMECIDISGLYHKYFVKHKKSPEGSLMRKLNV